MIVKTTRSPHQFIATQVKNYLLYKQQINCTHAIQTATTLPGTDMHFHSHPSDHRTTPVVQLKETRTKETTAAKILSPLSSKQMVIVQCSWCPSQGTGRARATCCRPRAPLPPLPPAQIHSLTRFFLFFFFAFSFRPQ